MTILGHTIAGASVVNTSGNTWTAEYTTLIGDAEGLVSFTINYTDIAGNAGLEVTAVTDGSSVIFDRTLPTLSSVSIASNNSVSTQAKVGNKITLTFTGSEPLTSKPTVTILGHTIASTSVVNTSGNTWTAEYTTLIGDAEGLVPFTINYTDIAGNAGTAVTAVTDGSSVTFDRTLPTLSSVSIASNNSVSTQAKVGDKITLTFTGSEPLTSKPTVTILGHTIASASVVNTSGNIWTAEYTTLIGDAEGAVPFTINYTDIAGNAGLAVTVVTDGSSVIFDRTLPTLSNVSIASNNSVSTQAKVGDKITLTFTGSEPLTSKPTVTILGHTIAGASVVNTSGNTWTAEYTTLIGDAEGVVPFTINYTDIAGNAGTAVTAVNRWQLGYL